jgi:hypothetical protein
MVDAIWPRGTDAGASRDEPAWTARERLSSAAWLLLLVVVLLLSAASALLMVLAYM